MLTEPPIIVHVSDLRSGDACRLLSCFFLEPMFINLVTVVTRVNCDAALGWKLHCYVVYGCTRACERAFINTQRCLSITS